MVQTVKHGLKSKPNIDIHVRLARFLLAYRAAPHSTTNASPAELFFQRPIKTRLDLLKPDIRNKVLQKMLVPDHLHTRDFKLGDIVLARNYVGKEKWRRGEVTGKVGHLTYTVRLDNGMITKRHINQMRGTNIPEEKLPIVMLPPEETENAVSTPALLNSQSDPDPPTPALLNAQITPPTPSGNSEHSQGGQVPEPSVTQKTPQAPPAPLCRSTLVRHQPNRLDL